MQSRPSRVPFGPVALVSGLAIALIAQSVTIGADTMWLVALGQTVLTEHRVPVGVPFFTANTGQWVNVPVAGEVAMGILDGLGPASLLTAQVLMVAAVLVGLALSARQIGADQTGTSFALAALVLGQLPSLGVVRAQLWSLPLFVVIACLLRSESRTPSRRLWLVPALIATWGNLHGGVLIGVALAGAYLLLERVRQTPWTASTAAAVVIAALWATPAGLSSHQYYIGVLTNVAAERGEGLWAPLDLSSLFGVSMLVSCLMLLVAAMRRRLPIWEYAVTAGLGLMTIQSARNGIWLALWLAPRAAANLRFGRPAFLASPMAKRAVAVVGTASILSLVVSGLAERSRVVRFDNATSRDIAAIVGHDRTTLAVSPMAERLAVEGVQLWAGNPIDALPQDRQAAYLDFLSRRYDSAIRAASPPEIMVLRSDDPVPSGHHLIAVQDGYSVYERDVLPARMPRSTFSGRWL